MKIAEEELKPSRAYHKNDTICGERRSMGYKGGPMKNALYV